MTHSSQSEVRIGPIRLKCPQKCQLISTAHEPEEVDRLLHASPDHTLYHLRPYLDFLRWEGATVETIAVVKNGELVFGTPVIARSIGCFESSFFGMFFSARTTEKAITRSVATLLEFFELNDHIRRFDCMQSFQSQGACDPSRRELLDCAFAAFPPPSAVSNIFTRVIELAPAAKEARLDRKSSLGVLNPAELDHEILKSYDPDLRNQIRQAERNGLTLRYHLVANAADGVFAEAYREYDPLHGESWKRTNLNPHTTEYWRRISGAVAEGGGVDLIVLALDGRTPIAGVTCHIYGEQAIYWSGGSIPTGLEKRGNPLSLHAAISICRRLGVRWFEVGRFMAQEDEKLQRIRHYKSQFGGRVLRVNNLSFRRNSWRAVVSDEAWRFRYRMPEDYPLAWKFARHLAPLYQRGTPNPTS